MSPTISLDRFAPLFDAFDNGGHELYLVGGIVRDAFMGRSEANDYDFCTSARPEETERLLHEAGFSTFPIGARFGTIATIVGKTQVEITTYRVEETYQQDSRKPEVVFGDNLEKDLERRDLSMNAMAMNRHGEIVDPFDGQKAIEDGILEVPRGGYDNTISILTDDPLRLLRIARFAARYDFRPTEETTRAATIAAPKLAAISHERWKMELDKLFVAPHVDFGFRWLAESGAFSVLSPVIDAAIRDGWTDAIAALLSEVRQRSENGWAALVALESAYGMNHDWPNFGSGMPAGYAERALALTQEYGKRFRLSNQEVKSIAHTAAPEFAPPPLERVWSMPELRRFYVATRESAEAALRLFAALHPDSEAALPHAEDRIAQLESLLLRENPVPQLPKGLGQVLAERFEIPKGPGIGEALFVVREAILDGLVDNGLSAPDYAEWYATRQH